MWIPSVVVLFSLILSLGGCQPKSVVRLSFDVALLANRNSKSEPLPVAVKVIQLRSKELFKSAGFEELCQDEKAVLGDTRISTEELFLWPNQKKLIRVVIDQDTSYVGLMALFREPTYKSWKQVRATRAGTGLRKWSIQVRPQGIFLKGHVE